MEIGDVSDDEAGRGFNTVNGKGCCNELKMITMVYNYVLSFNTVNGKGCCNSVPQKASIYGA